MAITRASKLIPLTDKLTGAVFQLSVNKIIKYTASSSNSVLTYISQRGKIVTRIVNEAVATIHGAALADTGVYLTQAITPVSGGAVIYLSNDRVIFVDALTASTLITYDEGSEAGLAPSQYEATLPTAANFNAATLNTFNITTQPEGSVPSKTRYINNLFIDQVVAETPITMPVIHFTTKVKSATGIVVTPGTLYTNPTVAITGGGGAGATGTLTTQVITATVVGGGTGGTPGAVTITGTTGTGTPFQATGVIGGGGVLSGALVVTVAGNYTVPITAIGVEPVTGGSLSGATVSVSLGLLAFTITGNGTGYTSYPTFGVVDATGINGAITANMLLETPLVIVDGGKDINTAITLTFSAGTTLATATATVSASLQKVTATNLTNAGAYKKGTDAYPSLVITGGKGATILYDIKGTSFQKLQVEELSSTIVSAVNGL